MEEQNWEEKEAEPTPFGTLRYAEDYRRAAEKVIGNAKPVESELLMPAHNLMAQSLELSLKAFLLSKGMTSQELKRKRFGHNLCACLEEAEKRGLRGLVLLDEVERHVMSVENDLFIRHEFRYIKTGYKTLPFWSEIGSLAKRLTHGLHDYCLVLRIGALPIEPRRAGRFTGQAPNRVRALRT